MCISLSNLGTTIISNTSINIIKLLWAHWAHWVLGAFHKLAWRSRVDSSEVPEELGNGKAKRGVACCHGKISGKPQDFWISRVDATGKR